MDSPRLNLLDEALIRIRNPGGHLQRVSLPELFVALGEDVVRDYPALRPHQRHPWHALLVQLAALALHEAGENNPWTNAEDWRIALLALTPEHPDGCAWCLLSPHDKPAFLQAPVPGGKVDGWKNIPTPDALDMLVTSKNHDLKGERMRSAEADDWLFALCSLQTDGMYSKAGPKFYYGSSRTKGCFSSRVGTGISLQSGCGARWKRNVEVLQDAREDISEEQGLKDKSGVALLWLPPWDGQKSIAFEQLDPFYIEVCRRARLSATTDGLLTAFATSSDTTRIVAANRNGNVGDAWTPIETNESLALAVTERGFDYKLITELLSGERFRPPRALLIRQKDPFEGLCLLAQGVGRGKNGITAGYHERCIPLAKKAIGLMRAGQSDRVALVATARVKAIATMREFALWPALVALIDTGQERKKGSSVPEGVKAKVKVLCARFERLEDSLFFDYLNREIEASDANAERLEWLVGLAARAEEVLRRAFSIGPQCGERRYRARSRALSYFHGALRSDKNFPALAQHLRSHPAAEEAVS